MRTIKVGNIVIETDDNTSVELIKEGKTTRIVVKSEKKKEVVKVQPREDTSSTTISGIPSDVRPYYPPPTYPTPWRSPYPWPRPYRHPDTIMTTDGSSETELGQSLNTN